MKSLVPLYLLYFLFKYLQNFKSIEMKKLTYEVWTWKRTALSKLQITYIWRHLVIRSWYLKTTCESKEEIWLFRTVILVMLTHTISFLLLYIRLTSLGQIISCGPWGQTSSISMLRHGSGTWTSLYIMSIKLVIIQVYYSLFKVQIGWLCDLYLHSL